MGLLRKPVPPLAATLLRAAMFLVCCLRPTPAEAALSIYMTPEALAERAAVVVEARVVASASGLDPQSGALATYVTLEIERSHRGAPDGGRLVLREIGGGYGDRRVEIDAVPVYRPGERVLAFLEPSSDGALRTTGMFYGKFTLDDDPDSPARWAVRELEGRGTILRGPDLREERLPLRDLEAVAATVPYRAATPARPGGRLRPGRAAGAAAVPLGGAETPRWLAVPAEYPRLRWAADAAGTAGASFVGAQSDRTDATAAPGALAGAGSASPAFAPLSSTYRARWRETDTGASIVMNVDPTGNPLGDASAALAEMQRAMAAWGGVPESRVALVTGETIQDYRATHSKSPTAAYTGTNVILFDDPYNEISDPSQCSGVLAIGGYWRTSSPNSTVNGVSFYGITQSHVIFNNDFECVLGEPDDLAEVATHELGHALGFGHSSVPDAIMRATIYHFRGPVLGDDDRDAAHCFYPHTLQLTRPNGSEVWFAGRTEAIEWTATPEAGADPGTVDLEYSLDGGASWLPLAQDEPNDGAYAWSVAATASETARVRVIRANRVSGTPAPFPSACSRDASNASFAIRIEVVRAGSVPQEAPSKGGIAVRKNGDGTLELAWGASCSTGATDYAIYEGSLSELQEGRWDHAPVTCSTFGQTKGLLFAGPGDRFFLVAARTADAEGDLGTTSSGASRPESGMACAPREPAGACSN